MDQQERIKHIFASRLKELREATGLTQGELADKLGVSRGSISYYEKCSRVPDIVFLEKAADFFGVGINFLMGHSENRDPLNEDLGLFIGLSDKAIEKLRGNDSFGLSLSAIIESDAFEKLFTIAEYFFLPSSYGYSTRYPFERCSINDEFEFYAFQISRVFTSILLDNKERTTEFFYNKFKAEFSESDNARKEFLTQKTNYEREFTDSLAQKAAVWLKNERAAADAEYEVWRNSDEYKARLKIYGDVKKYLDNTSSEE